MSVLIVDIDRLSECEIAKQLHDDLQQEIKRVEWGSWYRNVTGCCGLCWRICFEYVLRFRRVGYVCLFYLAVNTVAVAAVVAVLPDFSLFHHAPF